MADDKQQFDLSYLNQVFQGNRALVIQIVELFLQQVPAYVRMMENHLSEGNYAAIYPLAHKSKSPCSMLGLKGIENLLIEIESNGKAGKFENLATMIQSLSDQLNLCIADLKAYLEAQEK